MYHNTFRSKQKNQSPVFSLKIELLIIVCCLDLFAGYSLQVFSRSRRRPPLRSLVAINYRPFSGSENQESDSMLIMSPKSSSERNKQPPLISDLNYKRVMSEKCNVMSVKASNVSAFDAGAEPQPDMTLGSEPSPSS